jgi:hypothetical protein
MVGTRQLRWALGREGEHGDEDKWHRRAPFSLAVLRSCSSSMEGRRWGGSKAAATRVLRLWRRAQGRLGFWGNEAWAAMTAYIGQGDLLGVRAKGRGMGCGTEAGATETRSVSGSTWGRGWRPGPTTSAAACGGVWAWAALGRKAGWVTRLRRTE